MSSLACLTDEEILQMEYIVYPKYSNCQWRAVEGYFYELYIPSIAGQPSVYSSQVYAKKEKACEGAAAHLMALRAQTQPKPISNLIYSNR